MNSSFRKNGLRFVFVSLILVVSNSCQKPADKEAYLQNFRDFVERVKKYHDDYTKGDWEWADKRFTQYSDKWYDDFKEELTSNEKIEVLTLKLEYQNLKEPSVISDLLKSLKREDVDEIKDKIDEYIEKDLDEDVEKVMDGLKEIGDSAVKVVEDILEEIDNRF
ncbi:hypothetical protein GM418_08520 [Maribellus comscasis]|uniref:DUF6565 domain-containing protein n=1 Tax=Maribellus comscasis TaxID=2681766 RepID=A0A6I6JU44_9BACT|nr:DUF6565 domain-containing protein [Maribellus comscasis]QGY43697.1 hypothetical protein GM418_08520 [Maribellus comscasis]